MPPSTRFRPRLKTAVPSELGMDIDPGFISDNDYSISRSEGGGSGISSESCYSDSLFVNGLGCTSGKKGQSSVQKSGKQQV